MTYFQYAFFVVINWVGGWVGRGKMWCGGVGTYICKLFVVVFGEVVSVLMYI